MKNSLKAIFIICFILPLVTMGQERQGHKSKDRITKLRKEFIAEGLELTKEQQSTFWPVYDNFQIALSSLKKDNGRINTKISDMSDEEAQHIVNQRLKSRELEMQLQIKFYRDIQSIIPAKQILILNERERLFHKKAFDRVRNRRQNRRGS